jgi:anti-anti-sigma factor
VTVFEIATQGAVFVVRADEPISADAVAQARETIASCLSHGQPMAVLDLQNVPLIDSAGLEMLADQQEAFQRNGGCLKIAAANPLCRDILRCTGLARRFDLFADVKTAVGSFVR